MPVDQWVMHAGSQIGSGEAAVAIHTQVSVDDSAGGQIIVPANVARRWLIVQNNGSGPNRNIYITMDGSEPVAGTGYVLRPGEDLVLPFGLFRGVLRGILSVGPAELVHVTEIAVG